MSLQQTRLQHFSHQAQHQSSSVQRSTLIGSSRWAVSSNYVWCDGSQLCHCCKAENQQGGSFCDKIFQHFGGFTVFTFLLTEVGNIKDSAQGGVRSCVYWCNLKALSTHSAQGECGCRQLSFTPPQCYR